MIHMRPFTRFEERNITFLVNHSVDFTLVQLTATGLKKSIMDATSPMRTFFAEKGIHNYEEQLQGPAHKHLTKTFILNAAESKETTTSLYRPMTKKGDPRLWVSGLRDCSCADDIHAICALNGNLYVINITTCDIETAFNSDVSSHLKDLIQEFYLSSHHVSDELLRFFQNNANQWFESEVTADTGIGRTIETMLGISQNSAKTPDYKGIELKSHREKRSSKKNVLFTQTPNWELSQLKSGREIVNLYGYNCGDGRKTYQNTVQCNQPNSQGLGLNLELVKEWLELKHFGHKVEDVAVWVLRRLHDRLTEKHHETFWITVDNEMHDGKEYFRYRSIEHTKNPIAPQFDILLDQGLITVDLLLCRPSGHGDTYSFKIKKKGMPLLFPESMVYDLK
ncbi:MAG: MvaI/BcnI family restriction endonuclease [Bacteroidales bacterium]|nr:MvaI/BcnI family restriction endonuclease [Bacteroidales bacterium]